MNSIKNLEQYNISMRKALDDKLFFLEYLKNIDGFEDFGCADGTLLKAVGEHFPQMFLLGVDMNEDMLKRCKKNLREEDFNFALNHSTAPFTYTSWRGADLCDKMALNLSSVLHEVYSYGTPQSIDMFWKAVMTGDFEYVFVSRLYTMTDMSIRCVSIMPDRIRMGAAPICR